MYLKGLMKNEFESLSLRRYFKRNYGIEVGLYSYGCFDTSRIPRNTKIGRYCSFATTSSIFNGNHGTSYLTTHPYTYNTNLSLVKIETIERSKCIIQDDVWLGHNSIVTPSVTFIGRGAVIGAGSVVTKDVPPYAIVAGNPAKIIKYRFSPEIIEAIESTEWWNWDKAELKEQLNNNRSLIFSPSSHFAIRP